MQGGHQLRNKSDFCGGRLWRNIGHYAGYDGVKGAHSTVDTHTQPNHPRGNFVWAMLGGNFTFARKDGCGAINGTAAIGQLFERDCTCFGGNAFAGGGGHVQRKNCKCKIATTDAKRVFLQKMLLIYQGMIYNVEKAVI